MTDSEARRLERAWRQDPTDVGAARRALDALARAGLRPPRDLGRAARHEARHVWSPARLTVWATTPDGQELELGRTPGGHEVPASRRWGVTAGLTGGASLADGVEEARRLGAPGLRLGREVGRGLGALVDLPALEALELGELPDRRGWERIGALESLEWFRAGASVVQGDGPAPLARLTRLRHLTLAVAPRRAHVAPLLERLPLLEELDVRTAARDLPLRLLSTLPGAERLTALGINSAGPDLEAALARLPALRELVLHASDLDDAACRVLARAGRALERLELARCWRLTDDGLRWLATLPRLRELRLLGFRPLGGTSATLAPLRGAPLRRLTLGAGDFGGGADDALLAGLFPHPTLEELELDGDEGQTGARIAPSPALRRVRLGGAISWRGLEALAGSPLVSLEVTSSWLDANDLARFVAVAPVGLRRLVLRAGWRTPSALRRVVTPSAGRLAALRELGLVNHPDLGAASVAALLGGAPDLERLTLSGLHPGALAGVERHRGLRELVIDRAGERGLVETLRSLPRLRYVGGLERQRDALARAFPGVWFG